MNGQFLKGHLLGTGIGRWLLEIKRWRGLRSIPLDNPETAGLVGNDIIAARLLPRLCQPGGTFLDIGSHIGSVIASVHQQDPSVVVIAFEAEPGKAAALRLRYPFCHVFELAVGEAEGEAEFFVNPAAPGYNSLIEGNSAGLKPIKVRVAALDDLPMLRSTSSRSTSRAPNWALCVGRRR